MTSATLSGQANEEHLDFADMRRRIRAIFIGSIGNLVEWYDFYAYAAFALYFAGAFFPNSDPVVQQLNAALLFAAGFLVRPLGGWLFGYLADHHGRRGALMLSVSLMCFGSLMIAATPTYASIGIYAPFSLAIARIIQGLSLGGEYPDICTKRLVSRSSWKIARVHRGISAWLLWHDRRRTVTRSCSIR